MPSICHFHCQRSNDLANRMVAFFRWIHLDCNPVELISLSFFFILSFLFWVSLSPTRDLSLVCSCYTILTHLYGQFDLNSTSCLRWHNGTPLYDRWSHTSWWWWWWWWALTPSPLFLSFSQKDVCSVSIFFNDSLERLVDRSKTSTVYVCAIGGKTFHFFPLFFSLVKWYEK